MTKLEKWFLLYSLRKYISAFYISVAPIWQHNIRLGWTRLVWLLRLTDEFQVPILRALITGGPNARPQVLLMLIERCAVIVHFCHVAGNAAFQAVSYQWKAGVLPSICGTGFCTIAPLGLVFRAMIPNMFLPPINKTLIPTGLVWKSPVPGTRTYIACTLFVYELCRQGFSVVHPWYNNSGGDM